MAPEYRWGLKYSPASIREFPKRGLLVTEINAGFTVQLANVKVENNSLGFPDLDELNLQIHSPTMTFAAAEPPIGQKVKLRLYYNIKEDGTIRFYHTIGWKV